MVFASTGCLAENEERMRSTFIGFLLFCAALSAQRHPEFNDGESHGDAPFLVEDGWKPLLSGKDLSGWTGMDGKPMCYDIVSLDPETKRWSVLFFYDEKGDGGGFRPHDIRLDLRRSIAR